VSPKRVLGNHPYVKIALVTTPLVLLLIFANNQRQAEQKRRSDAQFRQSLIVTDRKFRQALAVTTKQFAYSTNKQVCAFRKLTVPALKSYKDAAKDETLSASARARNDLRIHTTEEFLRSLVTVPSDFKCSSLPRNPPTP
jgi:hypothetical protein